MVSDAGRMTLTTGRLRVRRLTLLDADAFHGVWGDPEVIFWGASPDAASSRALLRQLLGKRITGVAQSGWLAVIRGADHVFLGDVVLEPASWDPAVAEIGWHMGAAHQGKGYAREAASGLLEHARSSGLHEVWAKILPHNVPSRQVARHIGMQRAGTLEHVGRLHDLWVIMLP